MSGDTKKFDRDAVAEMLYRISQRQSFQSDIKKLRKRYGIPENGFSNEKSVRDQWLMDKWTFDQESDFNSEIEEITIKYKLPLGSWLLLEMYILTNNAFEIISPFPKDFFICEFDQLAYDSNMIFSIEDKWIKNGRPFARLYISENASLPMVKNYLDKHWRFIQKYVFGKTKSQKTIRRSRFSKRDELVWYYYNLSREELGLKSGYYKDIEVSNILREKHGIKITPDNIRKIVQRMKKLRDN